MKIMICGSMTFAKEMLKAKKKLEKLGYKVNVPLDTQDHIKNRKLIDDFEADYKHSQETNIMKKCFDLIAKSDGILVLNFLKNGIKGYVGTSSLMEIGLAYYLNKKIFLLNPIPKSKDHRFAHELTILNPTILKGNLNLIK